MASYPHFGTLATHAGQEPEQWSSMAIVPPITLSTTFKQNTPGVPEPYEYGRTNNPTRLVFEKCTAALEGAKYGVAAGSGMAATTMLCQMLKSGDHIVAMNDLYGGSYRFFNSVLSNYGIKVSFVDMTDLKQVEDAITPNTKPTMDNTMMERKLLTFLLYVMKLLRTSCGDDLGESLTNPLLRFIDLKAVAKIAKAKNILMIVDNTFMTPYFIRPLEQGADIVYHSVTKYLNGHSDVVMGVICTNNEDVFKKLKYLQNSSGCIPGPFDCFLANRGLKTLHVRMREHQRNATAVAQLLEASPHTTKVVYPGLPSHPNHETAKALAKGYSGMVTFFVKGNGDNVKKFFKALKVVTLAESLGGYESLVDYPVTMTHAAIPKEEREKIGITDTLVRMSVGLEDTDDILEDLKQALEASQA